MRYIFNFNDMSMAFITFFAQLLSWALTMGWMGFWDVRALVWMHYCRQKTY